MKQYSVIGMSCAACSTRVEKAVLYPIFQWKLDPMFAAAAMRISSFCVIIIALRLNFIKIYDTRKDKKQKK